MLNVMNTVRTVLLIVSLASAALADEVVLRNGSVFTGIVREEGDRVIVEVDFGTMAFRKVDVKSISRGEDPIRGFLEKSKSATDVKGMLSLAGWAREKGMGSRANELYRKVVVLDPDQAEARKALGYEKINGQWLTGDDLMTARGFVKFNGRWLAKETAERMQELEAQGRIEADRIALETRVADQRHSEELTRLSLERQRLEVERLREERGWWGRYGWGFGPSPFGGVVGYILPPPLPSSLQTVPPTPPTVIPLGSPSPVPPSRPK
jgi:hypothetical protein